MAEFTMGDLHPQKGIRYPKERKRLLVLMAEDQKERFSDGFYSKDPKVISKFKRRDKARMDEVFTILDRIKTPSVRNIGLDGSQAVWLIAQHSWSYKDAGRIVLEKLRNIYYRDKSQVYYQGIPYMIDRLMVGPHLENPEANSVPKQRFGTQGWCRKLENGTLQFEWYPVTNLKKLAERREKFGLKADREPGSCRQTE